MAQQCVSWFRVLRWAPVLGVALLAACGGGGNPSEPPRQAAADGEVAALSANPSSISIRYAVADTYQGLTSNLTHQLNVVDRLSGEVVWHTDLVARSDHATWFVSEGQQRDASTNNIQYLGPQLLHYVQQGKVFQIDIGGGMTLTPQRISSLTNACGFDPEIFPVQGDGRHAWLVVRTSGADGDCAQSFDNGKVLVFSSMPSTTDAIGVPSSQTVVLNSLADGQDGSTGLLTLDAGLRRIVIKSNDLTQTLHTFPGDVAPDQFVRLLAPLPGQSTRWLVQVGAQLRVLDRSSTTPTLGPVLASLTDRSAPLIYQRDEQGLYLANGHQLLSVNEAGTVSTLSSLPDEGGNANSLWLTTTSVLVLQDEDNINLPPRNGRVLWSIRRDASNRQALVQGQPYDETMVVNVENGLVYYTQWSESPNPTLRKIRDNGSGQALVASNIQLITAVIHPVYRPDSVSMQKLIWCEPLPERFDCGDGKVVAYDTASFAKTTLGTLPGNGAVYADARAVQHGWTGAQNLLFSPRWYTVEDSNTVFDIKTSLWLFSADTANSLRQVALPP
ncbi:hypothetical protein [Aquabacterium sp.]|uniref:hypothetical protein n=1 Tax=Aquabacterium sp. TaxID=1872578 RepID=UPI003D6D9A4F